MSAEVSIFKNGSIFVYNTEELKSKCPEFFDKSISNISKKESLARDLVNEVIKEYKLMKSNCEKASNNTVDNTTKLN